MTGASTDQQPSSDGSQSEVHPDLVRGLIGAAVAVSAWSTGTVLAKGIEMDGLAIGAYRSGAALRALSLGAGSREARDRALVRAARRQRQTEIVWQDEPFAAPPTEAEIAPDMTPPKPSRAAE